MEGHVPTSLKELQIISLLKKDGLDFNIEKNYRPVSNLSFLSKLLERIAASRLLSHMDKHHLYLAFQSAYKQHHSVETVIIRVQADILKAVDNKKLVLLILLDLSAAFDTIDHAILIALLKSLIGVDGKALDWFKSYLAARRQSVLIYDKASYPWDLVFGVPQG